MKNAIREQQVSSNISHLVQNHTGQIRAVSVLECRPESMGSKVGRSGFIYKPQETVGVAICFIEQPPVTFEKELHGESFKNPN